APSWLTSIPMACGFDTPRSCSAAGFRSAMRPVASSTTTPSSRLANTSTHGGRRAPDAGGADSKGVRNARNRPRRRPPAPPPPVEPPLSPAVPSARAPPELVDHLVEGLARTLPELLAHLPHPAGHALRVVLVDVTERTRITEVVEPALLGADECKTRHQPSEL